MKKRIFALVLTMLTISGAASITSFAEPVSHKAKYQMMLIPMLSLDLMTV